MRDSRRSVLILGGGIMQLPAIRAAKRLGLRVIVADVNDKAPGISEADAFEHVDLRDREGMRDAAAAHHERGELDAVFTAGTDFSATVAFVTESLGLPGTSLESALNATDKFRMRTVLRDAGVRVPEFFVLGPGRIDTAEVNDALEHVGLPCVVKPADSMGARGVVRADSIEEVMSLVPGAVAHSQSARVVLEGLIGGPEYSVDALVYGGQVRITGFADRHIRFPPHFIEMGHTIPAEIADEDYQAIISEFSRGVRALGINSGAAKGDMKLSADGPVVGEIAARLSGGFMSGWTYPFSSGVDLTENALRIALGEAPRALEPRWQRTCAERAIISIPGVVLRIEGLENASDVPGVSAVFSGVDPGERVRFPRSNVEKCGNVLATADSREDAILAAETAVSCVEVVLEPHCADTEAFLFEEGSPRWAFDPGGVPGHWLRDFRIDPGRIAGELRAELHRAGSRENGKPVRLGRVPSEDGSCDWSWRTLRSTIERLQANHLVDTAGPPEPIASAVWRGILKGGLQGGRYVLNTLRSN